MAFDWSNRFLRRRAAVLLSLAMSGALLSGCVAAAVPPIVAGAVLGKNQHDRRAARAQRGESRSPATENPAAPDAIPPIEAAPPAEAPAGRSADAIDADAFARAVALRLAAHGARRLPGAPSPRPDPEAAGTGDASALLTPDGSGNTLPCGDKSAAVIIDLDGLNGRPSVPADAGFARAIDALRAMGAKPLFFTRSRDTARTDALLTDLQVSGIGSGTRWTELWFPGGYAGATRAALFATAARHHCVLAIAGGSLDDFIPSGDGAEMPPGAAARHLGRRWYLLRELGAR